MEKGEKRHILTRKDSLSAIGYHVQKQHGKR